MTEANWDLFRLFSVVARTGSVNRAAHELGMSQPTLSRRLKELERHVGAPLFFRAASGVKLTPEGEENIARNQCLPDRLQPQDIANMVLFLASDDASMCTAQEFIVDAGWT